MIGDRGERQPTESDSADTTARLLRLAGLRSEVPVDRAARVRRAVLDECRAVARQRTIRHRTFGAGTLLAAAATAFLIVRLAAPPAAVLPPVREAVATVERVEGQGQRRGAFESQASTLTQLSPDETIWAGEWVETDAASRLGLRLAAGASVRFDRGSRARVLSSTTIELTEGALYVDSGSESNRLEIRTPFGTARDIGTQFEVRLGTSSLRVRVRTGLVELRRGDDLFPARPGTELTLGSAGAERRTVAAYGPEWDWVTSLVPPFEIEGRALLSFLDHLCREQGWTLRYADAVLAREASGIILHGSIAGLEPADALAVVLGTSGLGYRFQDGELVVSRADGAPN